MKTLELNDHELSVTDFSNFELTVQKKYGKCTASYETWTTPQGQSYIRVTHPVIEFDDSQVQEEELEELIKPFGFHRVPPA